MRPEAYWSDEHRCWFVPVASELFTAETTSVEPVRLELRDGQLWITKLDNDDQVDVA